MKKQVKPPLEAQPPLDQYEGKGRNIHSGRGAASALKQLVKWERRRAEDRATKEGDKPSRN